MLLLLILSLYVLHSGIVPQLFTGFLDFDPFFFNLDSFEDYRPIIWSENLGDNLKLTEPTQQRTFISIECPVLIGILVLLFTIKLVYCEKRNEFICLVQRKKEC